MPDLQTLLFRIILLKGPCNDNKSFCHLRGDDSVVNVLSGSLDRVGPEAPGADMHGLWRTINNNPDLADIRFLTNQGSAGNL